MDIKVNFSGRAIRYTEDEIAVVVEAMRNADPLTQGHHMRQFERALAYFQEEFVLAQEMGAQWQMGSNQTNTGDLWLRLGQPVQAELPELPADVVLPEGASPAAVTFARDWLVVVTQDGAVLVYDRAGALRGQVQVDQAP